MSTTGVSMMAVVGLVGGCGLVLTSMVTTHWVIVTDRVHFGLFSHCSSNKCRAINLTTETSISGSDLHSQFKLVRGLVITGLIVGVCGSLMSLGFVVDALRSRNEMNPTLLRSSLVLNPLGGVITAAGASVFVATIFQKLPDTDQSDQPSLGFSFWMNICGGSSLFVSGVLVYIIGPRTQRRLDPQRQRYPRTRTVMACVSSSPGYAPPSEEFLIAQFKPPPSYHEKLAPPSYEEVLLLPPPYEERTSVSST